MPERIFGHVPGYPVGSRFGSRAELSDAGLHKPLVAGISGSEREGADSVVLSGGYEDDRDSGHEIIYTGYGGRDRETGRQIADQNFSRGNRALAYSSLNGLPVRVIRGSDHASAYSPSTGYRYDGLYTIVDYWQETGKSGFRIWRYRLVKLPEDSAEAQQVSEEPQTYPAAPRRRSNVLRIVRENEQAQQTNPSTTVVAKCVRGKAGRPCRTLRRGSPRSATRYTA